MKSYGRAPTFLAMTGYEQVRSVAAAIADDLESADNVELTLPETGVCGGAGRSTPPCTWPESPPERWTVLLCTAEAAKTHSGRLTRRWMIGAALGLSGLFDAPEADQSGGSCCAPAPQLVQLGAPAAVPAAVQAGTEASAGGCCGS